MAKQKGKVARKPTRTAHFPPSGTVLTQDRSTPVTWCLACRAGDHDLCDRMEMRFCVCAEEGHEEEL